MRLCPGDELRADAARRVVNPDVRRVVDRIVRVHGKLPAVGRKARGPERRGFPDRSSFLPAPIEPEEPRGGSKSRRRDENAAIGSRKEREALPVAQADPLDGRDRVSLDLKT